MQLDGAGWALPLRLQGSSPERAQFPAPPTALAWSCLGKPPAPGRCTGRHPGGPEPGLWRRPTCQLPVSLTVRLIRKKTNLWLFLVLGVGQQLLSLT